MKYGKTIAAVVYAGLLSFHAIATVGPMTAEAWVQVAAAVVTAVGVYVVPIAPDAPWLKSVVAAGLAVLQVAGTAVVGGVDSTEVVLAVLAALGVYLAPASTETPAGDDLTVGWGSDALL